MNTAIDVKQLSVTLGNRHILHDINVSVLSVKLRH